MQLHTEPKVIRRCHLVYRHNLLKPLNRTRRFRSLDDDQLVVPRVSSGISRSLRYERVYLPLYKVADTPFHIQGVYLPLHKEADKTFQIHVDEVIRTLSVEPLSRLHPPPPPQVSNCLSAKNLT